jgi:hypothetical protein
MQTVWKSMGECSLDIFGGCQAFGGKLWLVVRIAFLLTIFLFLPGPFL